MSTEASELHRIIRASVRDMLDAYRIQAQAGPVSDQALEGIIFRATHPVVHCLAPYPAEQRGALLPSVVRMLLATFLENAAARVGSTPHAAKEEDLAMTVEQGTCSNDRRHLRPHQRTEFAGVAVAAMTSENLRHLEVE